MLRDLRYIDFHTHIFPEKIAEEALRRLAEHSGEYKPRTDGTARGLVESMQEAGIRLSVVANIATKPSQMLPIFEFCLNVKSERVYPLVSFHPQNSMQEVKQLLQMAIDNGIKGVKLHPMYQGFYIDEEMMYPFYEEISKKGMFLMFHSGYDIAFPGNRQADIERIRKVAKDFPEMTIISTHMGGWRQWERLKLLKDCSNVYVETSMTVTETGEEAFIEILKEFDIKRVFFGTDSPWTDQKEMIEVIERLPIPEEYKEMILYRNAETFLAKIEI
jgi:hypothetical protein